MRRTLLIMVAAATLAASGWAAHAATTHPTPAAPGARFSFWHPDLVTLHVWLWYPNPAGLYGGTNPLIRPFNHG
jgi:ABC-type glycerol-3-phosphate transport system substrate-binding protein